MPRSQAVNDFSIACESLQNVIAEYGSLSREEAKIVEMYCRELLIIAKAAYIRPEP